VADAPGSPSPQRPATGGLASPDLSEVRAVIFDVGETLIDETREYGTWADWLGVPRHTFSAVFGAVLARGEDYRHVFQHFRPDFDLAAERQARLDAGLGEYFNSHDLYPDARPALHALRDAGYFVGIAGNQTARAEQFIRELHLPTDFITTSDELKAEKPDPDFFHRLVAQTPFAPGQVLYVGDRLDNDVRPARAAGLATAFIHRGPWANAYPLEPSDVGPDLVLEDLRELGRWLARDTC
jgi:HAD superfamily hydrolase (TIGR01549 family)